MGRRYVTLLRTRPLASRNLLLLGICFPMWDKVPIVDLRTGSRAFSPKFASWLTLAPNSLQDVVLTVLCLAINLNETPFNLGTDPQSTEGTIFYVSHTSRLVVLGSSPLGELSKSSLTTSIHRCNNKHVKYISLYIF